MSTKYIRTQSNLIIVFSEMQQHRDFGNFNPKSAGFISFIEKDGNLSCVCYGESISLNLKSLEEEDSIIATRQILNGNNY